MKAVMWEAWGRVEGVTLGAGRGRTSARHDGSPWAAAVLAAVLLAACGGARDPGARVRSTFPAQAARVLEGGRFVATPDGFAPAGDGETATRGPLQAAEASLASRHGLRLALPAEGHLAATLSLPGGFAVQVRERGLAGAGRLVEGAVAYQRPGATSFWTAVRDGYEEWLHVEGAGAGPVAEWEVRGATLRQAGDAVELLDAAGAVRLRVTAPSAYDASGAHARAWLVAQGPRLALHTDARGAALVDPLWTTPGSLVAARGNHSATLLANGKVLVAGGFAVASRLATAELYDPATGTWTSTGSLVAARDGHAAVRLRNGKVLVAGGTNGTAPLASAELYDPVTGTWAATGLLSAGRSDLTLTLLADGRVLAAGGADAVGAVGIAEIYTEVPGTWTTTGPLMSSRAAHTATLLPTGKVLVAGGAAAGSALASTELFDPALGTWSSAGTMWAARSSQTATLLTGGKVLVAGGGNGPVAVASAELYDPAALPAAAWSATGAMTGARKLHSATLLPSGKVVVAGGSDGTVSLASAELYDPALGTWAAWIPPAPPPAARSAHTATLLPGGAVLLAGGLDAAGAALASAEQLDPAAGGFAATGAMVTERRQQTTTLLANGKVLVTGGLSATTSSTLGSAELYDPALGTWASTGPMAQPRFNHRAVLLADGTVLVAGGYDQNSVVLATAELYNPVSKAWTATGSMQSGRVFFAMTLLPNGKVLAAGGPNALGVPQASAEIYDPITGTWTATAPMNSARAEFAATLLANGQVLAVGGYDAAGVILTSAEVFEPATGSWSATGPMSAARTQQTVTLLPSGRVLVVGGNSGPSTWPAAAELYDPALKTWSTSGSMIDGRRLHVAALLPSGKVLVAGGVGLSAAHTPYRADAEVFDPAIGTWSVVGPMATARTWCGAAILPSGKVLVAGGAGSAVPAEQYDEGRGAGAGLTPTLVGTLPAQVPGTTLALTGTLFTGVSEGSGGGARSSPANAPLVRLERSEGQIIAWAPVQAFTATTLTATLPVTLEPGWYWLRVVVNGVPSVAQPILIIAPALQSVAPASGPTAGGTAVALGGSGFVAGSTVKLGGVAATNVIVASANVINATAPVHAAGAVDVVVISPGGSIATRATAFTYVPPPAPASVAPSGGLPAGGTAVTISGTAFLSGATVTFGGTSATGVVVVNPTSITATSPSHAAGVVNVVVTNPDGQAGTLVGGFTYAAAPTVSAITPNLDRASGGAAVNITGTGFMTGATVVIGGTSVPGVVVVNPTSITATAPAHAAGTFDLVVTNPTSQSATLAGAFTYVPPPTLSAVAPSSGWANRIQPVTLTGAAFQAGAAVTFGATSATNVIVVSTNSLTAVAPALSTGTVSVVVTNQDGQSSTLPAAYTYVPPPVVSNVAPWAGLASGNTLLTLTGSGFSSGAGVTLGGVAATGVNVVGPTTITATSPSHAAGAVDVVVTNLDGQSGTLPAGYTFALAPTVTAIAPASGPTAGGTSVTVTGTGFAAGARLTIAGTNAIATSVVSTNTITATTPAGPSGAADVQVTNLTGLSATRAGGFTYVPPPAVGGISPTFGPATLNTLVTISGSAFLAPVTVSVGGAAASNVVVASATTITATLPPHASGPGSVVVTNGDGQTSTGPGAFTWVAPPSPASVTPASGGTGGGQTVTVNGSGFAPGVSLTFGGVAAPTVTFVSASSLNVVTPAHAFGPVSIVATNPDGQVGSLAAAFTYLAPAPSAGSVTPASGPAAGGTAVTIGGTGFLPGAAVSFGGASATNVTVASDTAITATVPAHAAGAVDVVVLNVDGQSAKITGGFTFVPAPAPSRISPASGLPAGGTDVTIGGADFAPGATVTFCGAPAIVKAVSATSITATTPPHLVGVCDVAVTNPDGQVGTFRGGYTYAEVPVKDLFAMSCAHAGGPGGWLSLLIVLLLLRWRRREPHTVARAVVVALALVPALALAQAAPPDTADIPATGAPKKPPAPAAPKKPPATGGKKKAPAPGATKATPAAAASKGAPPVSPDGAAPGGTSAEPAPTPAERSGVIRVDPVFVGDADVLKDLPPPGATRARKPETKKEPDKKKEKVALLPPKAGVGIEPKLAEAVADSLAAALHRRDVPVVSTRDIEAALGFERQRQLHGCSEDASCMAEIGGALGVDRIVSGSLARFGETLVLTVQLLDARRATVARRAEEKMAAGDAEQMLEAMDRVAYALFPAGGPPPERVARGSWGLGLRCVGSNTAPGGATTALVEYRATPDLRLALGPTLTWAGRPGAVVRIAWAPFRFAQRWALLFGFEGHGYFDQVLITAGSASAGIEWAPTRHLSVALEVPVVYLLSAPEGYRKVYVTPGLTAGWRF